MIDKHYAFMDAEYDSDEWRGEPFTPWFDPGKRLRGLAEARALAKLQGVRNGIIAAIVQILQLDTHTSELGHAGVQLETVSQFNIEALRALHYSLGLRDYEPDSWWDIRDRPGGVTNDTVREHLEDVFEREFAWERLWELEGGRQEWHAWLVEKQLIDSIDALANVVGTDG